MASKFLRVATLVGLVSTIASAAPLAKKDSKPLVKRSYAGPVISQDFPDPSVINVGGTWYAFATGSGGKNIQTASSSDFNSWSVGGDALPNAGSWTSSSPATWAPDINTDGNGNFWLYYTAVSASAGVHCIGVATSNSVTGPFNPQDSPLACPTPAGAIDPSGYFDGSTRWLLYKIDGNSLGGASSCHGGGLPNDGSYESTPIMLQKMSGDGLTPQGDPVQIFDNDGADDDGVTEAPSLVRSSNGDYILFYSNHCYSSDEYAVRWASAPAITGPYTRQSLLFYGDNIWGAGSADVDPDGQHMLFHGRVNQNDGGAPRYMYQALIDISGDGVSA